MYHGITIIPVEHMSGDKILYYPLLFPYGTVGWSLEQRLHTILMFLKDNIWASS
jgi:hypothetical protein